MSRIWRWITPAAVAVGLIAGLPSIPAAMASTAATSITINATSPHYPGLRARNHGLVDGYALVIYEAGRGRNTGVVSGKVLTRATNDTATLLARPFRARRYTVAARVTLTPTIHGIARYSFNVTPSLATSYKVRLTGTDFAVSAVVNVYVATGGRDAHVRQRCSATQCRFSFRNYTMLPASAYRLQSRRRWYLYQAVGYPRVPSDYTLSSTATASRPRRINSGEFVQTFTFYIPLRNGGARWQVQGCTQDIESRDGMGLPGHHGCGDRRVPRSAIYLG